MVMVSKKPSCPSMNSSTATLAPRPTPKEASARARSAASSTRTVPEAPAASRGLTTSGKPTRAANARISSGSPEPIDCAQGMPAARSASFIAGLSRQRKVVFTLVPGMPHASRTRAAHITCASTTASSRSTRTLDCTNRTARSTCAGSVTLPICS
jgi:hypothetical protein